MELQGIHVQLVHPADEKPHQPAAAHDQTVNPVDGEPLHDQGVHPADGEPLHDYPFAPVVRGRLITPEMRANHK